MVPGVDLLVQQRSLLVRAPPGFVPAGSGLARFRRANGGLCELLHVVEVVIDAVLLVLRTAVKAVGGLLSSLQCESQ